MSSTIIFSNACGRNVKKIVQGYGHVTLLLEDGELVQPSEYGPSYRLPPDLFGLKIVDMVEDASGSVVAQLSDGSHITQGTNLEWMESHGYVKMPTTEYAVPPSGRVYRWHSETTGYRRQSNSKTHRWVECGRIDAGSVVKVVTVSNYKEGLFMLTNDGRITQMIETEGKGPFIVPAPWADEAWRFKDIMGGPALHAITTDGQVVTPFVSNEGYIASALWPLPESNAVRFLTNSNMPSVVTESGSVIFYTNRGDWKGKDYHLGEKGSMKCTAYNEHIVGAKPGDWLELAGAMIALGRPFSLERFAPYNLRARGAVKTMKALGGI